MSELTPHWLPEYSGPQAGLGLKVAIVTARFNHPITSALKEGATQTLLNMGVLPADIEQTTVPGAFELPLACKTLAQTGQFNAVIAFGCVIQGDTDHYDYVCQAVTHGLIHANLQTNVPIVFGVLTVSTFEQALARVGGPTHLAEGNKGVDAAYTAVEMARLQGNYA